MADSSFSISAVLETLRCTPDDLVENRQGRLSKRQCSLLPTLAREQQFDARGETFRSAVMLGGCAGFFAFVGVAGFISSLQREAFDAQVVGAPISLAVLFGALIVFQRVVRMVLWAARFTTPARNLKADQTLCMVRRAEGRVGWRESGDLDALLVGAEAFEYHDALRAALPEGVAVVAYYTPHRRVLVGIEAANSAPGLETPRM